MNVRLVVGHHHLMHQVAPNIAIHEGYFSEAGLDSVEVLVSGRDQKSIEMLIDGDADIALDLKTGDVSMAKVAGKDLCIIAGWFTRDILFGLVGAKGINKISDLKGKVIGVREIPDGYTYNKSRIWLRHFGLDPDKDVAFMPTGDGSWQGQKKLLDSGRIHARYVHTRARDEVIAEGYPILLDNKELFPEGYAPRVIVSTNKFVDANPQTVKAVLHGIFRAYDLLRKEESWPHVVDIIFKKRRLKFWDEDPSTYDRPHDNLDNLTPDGLVTVGGVEGVLKEQRMGGFIPETLKAADILRLELAKEVLKDMGR